MRVRCISDCYMQELACIATQYMPIRVRCIGMYCGMYYGMYWWHVLNTYFNIEYIPVCVGRAEVRRSFITTTVREEPPVTPQGPHR